MKDSEIARQLALMIFQENWIIGGGGWRSHWSAHPAEMSLKAAEYLLEIGIIEAHPQYPHWYKFKQEEGAI